MALRMFSFVSSYTTHWNMSLTIEGNNISIIRTFHLSFSHVEIPSKRIKVPQALKYKGCIDERGIGI